MMSTITKFLSLAGYVFFLVVSSPEGVAQQPAKRANDFMESFGMSGVKVQAYSDAQWTYVKQRLDDLKVRYVRNWIQGNPVNINRQVELYNEQGVKWCLIFPVISMSVDEGIGYLKNGYPSLDLLLAIEGLNEPFNFSEGTAQDFIDHQTALWNTVQNDSELKDFPVLAPSLAQPDRYARLGNMSGISDLGNLHSYPTTALPPEGGRLEDWINAADPSHPGQPMWTTEAGYHDNTNIARQPGVPSLVEAKYLPRMFMHYFLNERVDRIFHYRLLENKTGSTQKWWGIVNDNATLSPKPAFTAWKNMAAILDDRDVSFTPGNLDYSYRSSLPADIGELLLQKGDGRYYLILWQKKDNWDAPNENTFSDVTVTLDLGTSISQAKTYLPSFDSGNWPYEGNGTSPTNTYSNPTSLSLSIPDHILIVELTPKSTTPPGNGFLGTHKLLARHSGKALAVDLNEQTNGGFSNATADGVNVFLYGADNRDNRLWDIQPVGDGYYQLISVYSGKALAVDTNPATNGGFSNTTVNGVNVFQYGTSQDEDDNRLWKIEEADEGYHVLINRQSGRALDVYQASEVDGANVQQWGTGSQNPIHRQWQLVAVNDNAREAAVSKPKAEGLLSPESEVRLYPNPANERLTVEAVGQEAYQVMMYDLTGRLMLQHDHLKGKTELDISHLRPGVYLLKLRDSSQHELRRRILVE